MAQYSPIIQYYVSTYQTLISPSPSPHSLLSSPRLSPFSLLCCLKTVQAEGETNFKFPSPPPFFSLFSSLLPISLLSLVWCRLPFCSPFLSSLKSHVPVPLFSLFLTLFSTPTPHPISLPYSLLSDVQKGGKQPEGGGGREGDKLRQSCLSNNCISQC